VEARETAAASIQEHTTSERGIIGITARGIVDCRGWPTAQAAV
jgi:hypothetical protein